MFRLMQLILPLWGRENSLGEVLFPLTWLIRLGSGSATFGASKGGIGYQKTKVLPVKTDNLMQFHPAGPW